MDEFIQKLEMLRQFLPDPFPAKKSYVEFYNNPVAKEMISEEATTISGILSYLDRNPSPALVTPSVLLLSYFEAEKYYPFLLTILAHAEKPVVEAFEKGLWEIKLEEETIAADLIKLAPLNPNVLLLLQRPVAGKFKKELKEYIRDENVPLSNFALYCYKYALEEDDALFLRQVSAQTKIPEIKSITKEYLGSAG